MFCKYCHYEFYVSGDTLGGKVRCPNCTGTLRVEDKQLLYPCPKCRGMLNVDLWMIGSASSCPHCNEEIVLSLGEDSFRYFPEEANKHTAMLKTASKKAGDIIGKYRVIRCLGIGGMGEVYLVEHTLLNTRCALKLLKSEIARQDPEMRARLLREARLASQIQHPNLIAVLDAELDENSESCYIVMEYVDGVSIENILVDGPMLEDRVLEIIEAVAEALKVAAAHKIIHRDIKPANIMLSRSGEVKLADLGIAKVESDNQHNMTLTMDNAVLGTPNYASPEQLRSSHQVDSRADIYSLGASMYHMLTGKRPFEAESVFGVMANVLEKEAPPVRSLNPEVSEKTSDLISRMMAKKRVDRPENFDLLISELRSGNKRKRLLKFKKIPLSRIFTFRNIWQLFLGIVAVAGLIVASKILYAHYQEKEKAASEVEANANAVSTPVRRSTNVDKRQELIEDFRRISQCNYYVLYAGWQTGKMLLVKAQHSKMDYLDYALLGAMEAAFEKQINFRKDLRSKRIFLHAVDGVESTVFQRYRDDLLNNNRSTTSPAKSVAEPVKPSAVPEVVQSVVATLQESEKAVDKTIQLTEALKNLDLLEVRTLASELNFSAENREKLENVVRAAIRLDYARCRRLADEFVGDEVIKAACNKVCSQVRSSWGLATYVKNKQLLQPTINYIENTKIHQGNPVLTYRLHQVKQDTDSTRLLSQGLGVLSMPATVRALVKKGDLKVSDPLGHALRRIATSDYYSRKAAESSANSRGHSNHKTVMFATASILLDAGFGPRSAIYEDMIRRHPQFAEFWSGEKFAPYDYTEFDRCISTAAESAPDEQVRDSAEEKTDAPEPVAAAAADSSLLEVDFGKLPAALKRNFIPSFLDGGVLKMDGLYPYSAGFREKHGANAPLNFIKFDQLDYEKFTISMIYYPLDTNRSYMPLLVAGRTGRWLSITLNRNHIRISVSGSSYSTFTSAATVLNNAWHQFHVAFSLKDKTITLMADNSIQRFKLPDTFALKPTLLRNDFYFYNFGGGSAFKGYVGALRICNKVLDGAELQRLNQNFKRRIESINLNIRGAAQAEIGAFESDVEKFKQLLQSSQDSAVINDSARKISKAVLTKCKELVSEKRYDECTKVLKSAMVAKRSETVDEWNAIANILQNEYCEAMKISDNCNIGKIYNSWRSISPGRAIELHELYCKFEYLFFRNNMAEAKMLLAKNRRMNSKYIQILQEKLNMYKEHLHDRLNRTFGNVVANNYYWAGKEVVDAMKEADCPEAMISSSKKRLRRIPPSLRKSNNRMVKSYLSAAVFSAETELLRHCLGSGTHHRDKLATNSKETAWERLISNLNSSSTGSSQRFALLSCIVAISDKESLNLAEKRELGKMRELSDFVLKK